MKRTFFAGIYLLLNSFFVHIPVSGQIISTIVGTGVSGYNGNNIAADTAQIGGCLNVAIDNYGNLYYSDYVNNRVRMVNESGLVTTIAGGDSSGYSGDGGPATLAKLNIPRGIAINKRTGNVYFADAGNNVIRMIDQLGNISTVVGNGCEGFEGDGGAPTAACLNYPVALAIDTGGQLFVVDQKNNCIRWVNEHGVILTICGNGPTYGGYWGDGGKADTALLHYPSDIAIDYLMSLDVADMLNNRVRQIDTAGFGHINTISGNYGVIYNGTGGLATNTNLDIPTGVACDYFGNVYIADYYHDIIRKVNQNGYISDVAGVPDVAGYNGDGIYAGTRQLNGPQGVAVDAAQNIYIADYGNYRIRKVNVHEGVEGINKTKAQFIIAPNPVTANVMHMLIATDNILDAQICIVNSQGVMVKQMDIATNTPYDIPLNLAEGTYFIKAVTSGSTLHSKFCVLNRH